MDSKELHEYLKPYFTFKYVFTTKPCFKVSLKQSLKTKQPLFKDTRHPVSGAEERYYIHYLGTSLGKEIYQYRKQLFGIKNLTNFFIKNNLLTNKEIEQVSDYLKFLEEKTKKNHAVQTQKEEYRERLKQGSRRSREVRSQKARLRWALEDNKQRYKRVMFSPEALAKRAKSYRTWCDNNKETIKLRVLQRNLNSPWVLDNLRQSSKKNYTLNNVKMNSIEYLVGEVLNELNLSWKYEKKIFIKENTLIPDFYLPDYNLVIECFGDYWHCNPIKFPNEKQIIANKKTVAEIRKRDRFRKELFLFAQINFLSFWEHDILKNKDFIKQTILNFINNYGNRK